MPQEERNPAMAMVQQAAGKSGTLIAQARSLHRRLRHAVPGDVGYERDQRHLESTRTKLIDLYTDQFRSREHAATFVKIKIEEEN